MKKQIIKLTESDLHNIISKCVNEIRKRNYWAESHLCPRCKKREGNPFLGGLCPDCAKGKNIESQAKI